MPDPLLTQAIQEAYNSAPTDEIIFHTLELRHPAFVDDTGAATAIRVVQDIRPGDALDATLEDSAPLHAGQTVTFRAVAFDLSLPKVATGPIPEIALSIDNVDRQIVREIAKAAVGRDRIEVTYRPYLSSDLSGPQMNPPLTLTLVKVRANALTISGTARIMDAGNRPFPADLYTASRFPGLVM